MPLLFVGIGLLLNCSFTFMRNECLLSVSSYNLNLASKREN